MTIFQMPTKRFNFSVAFSAACLLLLFSLVVQAGSLGALEPKIFLGVDRVFDPDFQAQLKGKRVGLITNHTGVSRNLTSTIDLFRQKQKPLGFTLKALFAPEHGLYGEGYAGHDIAADVTADGIPIHSLHGATRRPTKEMLAEIDLLVFDIQDIGSRSYTYASTLFYAMEEAAKVGVTVVVLDRPNPMGGLTVDGPMLEKGIRSFVGYINVPYCHGMTIGELATFFNAEYSIGCDLKVVPMKGWKRTMSFADTGLAWVPTSPYIPEAMTCYSYPATGFMGEISFVSIGIGYTLPFKVIAAPWISAEKFSQALNAAHLPGVRFTPIRIKPFSGKHTGESCQGALIIVSQPAHFLPVTTQYLILATLKKMYPKECAQALKASMDRRDFFVKITGTKTIHQLLMKPKPTFQEFRAVHHKEREEFKSLRKKYLNPDYSVQKSS